MVRTFSVVKTVSRLMTAMFKIVGDVKLMSFTAIVCLTINVLFCSLRRQNKVLITLVYFCLASSVSIDSGISKRIQQSSKLTMTKVIENGNGRTELAISAMKEEEKKTVLIYGKNRFTIFFRERKSA